MTEKEPIQFTGAYWRRGGRRTEPLVDHLPTTELETGFEETDRFVSAYYVATLIEILFRKGVLDMDDLRAITDDETLERADD